MAEGRGDPRAPLELRFKPDVLCAHGLPDILYPITTAMLDDALGEAPGEGGDLDFALLLNALQQRSAGEGAAWQEDEPAMMRLAELIAPADERTEITAAGPEWWIEIGPVDLALPVVTIQRGKALIASLARREDGRLRLATYRPLDGRSAQSIITMALRPHEANGTVCMLANNWDYALDCSSGMGQTYAAVAGQSYLSYWAGGLGQWQDGTIEKRCHAMRALVERRSAIVAIELGVAYAFSSKPPD